MYSRMLAWLEVGLCSLALPVFASELETPPARIDSLYYIKYEPAGFQIFNNCFEFYVTPGVLANWSQGEMLQFVHNFLDDDTLDGSDIFTQVWRYFNDGDLDSSQAGIRFPYGDTVLTKVRLDLYDPNDFDCENMSNPYCRGVGWGSTGWVEVANRRAYSLPTFASNEPLLLGLLAHELQHSASGMSRTYRDKWLEESFSELARYLTGNFKVNRGVYDYNIPYDNSLVTGVCCQGYTSKYWHWYLWACYLYEQFPGETDSIQDDFMFQLARTRYDYENSSGIYYLAQIFEKPEFHRFGLSGFQLLKEVFNNWTIANFLDDISLDQGQYGYKKIDIEQDIGLFRFNYGAPIPNSGITPSVHIIDSSYLNQNKSFKDSYGNDSLTVEVYSADYIRLIADSSVKCDTGLDLSLSFSWDYQDSANVNIGLQVNCLLYSPDSSLIGIEKMNSGSRQAWITIPGFGAEVAELVIVVNAIEKELEPDWYYYNKQRYDYAIRLGSEAIRPEVFELYQNYPNPFNSKTVIKFYLTQASEVRLDIYNLLGQKVRTLLNQKLEAGGHQITWDGSDHIGRELTSGLYFYRLRVGGLTQSKKMLLVK